jgi:hypothetical protein
LASAASDGRAERESGTREIALFTGDHGIDGLMERREIMGVFKKQGVYWIDYYVQGHRQRERIGPDKRLAETILKKRRVEIAEGRFPEKKRPVTTTFDELADAYLSYSRKNKRSWDRDMCSMKHLAAVFSRKRLVEISPADVERYKALRQTETDRRGRHPNRPRSPESWPA